MCVLIKVNSAKDVFLDFKRAGNVADIESGGVLHSCLLILTFQMDFIMFKVLKFYNVKLKPINISATFLSVRMKISSFK